MKNWTLALAAACLGAGLALSAPASAAPAIPSAVSVPDAAIAVQMMGPGERRMRRQRAMRRSMMRSDRRMMRHDRRMMRHDRRMMRRM